MMDFKERYVATTDKKNLRILRHFREKACKTETATTAIFLVRVGAFDLGYARPYHVTLIKIEFIGNRGLLTPHSPLNYHSRI
jgi:hypothetical protein